MIQNLWPWVLERTDYNQNNTTEENNLRDPINVALIDDGVSIPNIELCDKILGGKSFDYVEIEKKRHIRPYYASERGHGTVMARMISRVCPMAKIYVIRLETHYDHQEQKVRITPNSAAEVRFEPVPKLYLFLISLAFSLRHEIRLLRLR